MYYFCITTPQPCFNVKLAVKVTPIFKKKTKSTPCQFNQILQLLKLDTQPTIMNVSRALYVSLSLN